MDKRIKGSILTYSDIKNSKNLLGCFGYFGDNPLDFKNLDVSFYGQLTEFPKGSFFGTPDDTGGVKEFLMFLPEMNVSNELEDIPEEIELPEPLDGELLKKCYPSLNEESRTIEERLSDIEKELDELNYNIIELNRLVRPLANDVSSLKFTSRDILKRLRELETH